MTDYSGNELIIEKTRLERDSGVILENVYFLWTFSKKDV